MSRLPRLYAPDLPLGSQVEDGAVVTLDRAASAHLAQVLRARPGDQATLFDGRGNEFLARVETSDKRSCQLRLGPWLRSEPHPNARLQLLQAALKSGLEGVILQATELGATDITIFRAERSAPTSLRQGRAHRIAIGAAEQSGRLFLPTVTMARSFAAALHQTISGERFIALPDAPPLDSASADGNAAIAIGPEGGFTPSEVELAGEASFRPLGLGPLTLRAATAGPAAIAAWQQMHRWQGTAT